MEEIQKKKKGKGPVITIILLVIIILGLVCYICYDKGMIFSKKAEKETKTEEKTPKKEIEENVTFSDSELEKYVNYISPSSYGPSELLYNIDTVDAKSLSVSDKIKYIAGQVYSKHTSTSDYSYDIISEADVKSILEEIYGPNTYEKTTFNLGCGYGTSIKEVLETIEKVLGLKMNIVYKKGRAVDVPVNYLDIRRYEKYYGKLNPVSLEEGVKKTAEFMKHYY